MINDSAFPQRIAIGSESAQLNKEIEKVTVQLDQILERTNGLNDEQLNFKPSASDWSILQVIQHLIIAETQTNLYLRKKIKAGNVLKSAGLGTKIKTAVLKFFMSTLFKFKAPEVVDVKMDEEYNYDDQVKEWIFQRNEIISFLNQVDESFINKLLFKHGSGVRMNLVQMLNWTYVHAERHTRQIERITKHPKFPVLVNQVPLIAELTEPEMVDAIKMRTV